MPRLIANIRFEDAVQDEISRFQSILSERSYRCLGSHFETALSAGHPSCMLTVEKKGTPQRMIRELKDVGNQVGRLFAVTVMQSRH